MFLFHACIYIFTIIHSKTYKNIYAKSGDKIIKHLNINSEDHTCIDSTAVSSPRTRNCTKVGENLQNLMHMTFMKRTSICKTYRASKYLKCTTACISSKPTCQIPSGNRLKEIVESWRPSFEKLCPSL